MAEINDYCRRLGLSAVKVSELTIAEKTAVRDLLLAVLLELGRPVTLTEAVSLLERYEFGQEDMSPRREEWVLHGIQK